MRMRFILLLIVNSKRYITGFSIRIVKKKNIHPQERVRKPEDPKEVKNNCSCLNLKKNGFYSSSYLILGARRTI